MKRRQTFWECFRHFRRSISTTEKEVHPENFFYYNLQFTKIQNWSKDLFKTGFVTKFKIIIGRLQTYSLNRSICCSLKISPLGYFTLIYISDIALLAKECLEYFNRIRKNTMDVSSQYLIWICANRGGELLRT